MKLAALFAGSCLCMLCACHKGIIGDPDYRHEKPSIDAVSYTPQFIITGDTVLIDLTIGTEVFYDDGTYNDDVPGSHLQSSAGEIIGLRPAHYSAGDPLPDFEQVQATGSGTDQFYGLLNDGHVYLLFRAPDSPQLVYVEYWIGGSAPVSSRNHVELSLEVH
ncbi:MAG: hypothetical protein KDE09_10625 [Anaerolineales bacterium]|nr:hypothetical protein [Anaerolineales bacterium]MCB1218903.1 hypothetical protein [bacterium]